MRSKTGCVHKIGGGRGQPNQFEDFLHRSVQGLDRIGLDMNLHTSVSVSYSSAVSLYNERILIVNLIFMVQL